MSKLQFIASDFGICYNGNIKIHKMSFDTAALFNKGDLKVSCYLPSRIDELNKKINLKENTSAGIEKSTKFAKFRMPI